MRKFLSAISAIVIVAAALLVLAGCGSFIENVLGHAETSGDPPITIIIDGMEMPRLAGRSRLIIVNNTVLAPYESPVFGNHFSRRSWGRGPGGDYSGWAEGRETAYMTNYAHGLRFTIGSNILESHISGNNTRQIPMDMAPILVEGILMIPVQATFEAIQAQVDWDYYTATMTIRSRAYMHGRTVLLDGDEVYVWATIASDGRIVLAIGWGGRSTSWYHDMYDIMWFLRRYNAIILDGEEISPEQLMEALLSDVNDTPPEHMAWLDRSPISIILDGVIITRYRPGSQPVLAHGRLFAPYDGFLFWDIFSHHRWCSQENGFIHGWQGGSEPVYMLSYEGHNMRFTLGSTIMEIILDRDNTIEVELGAAPFLLDGTPMVPVRAVFEGIQARVDWDAETRTATISTREHMYSRTVLLDGEEYTMWASQAPDGRIMLVSRQGGSTWFFHHAEAIERHFGSHIITMDGEEISMEQFLEHLLLGTGGRFVVVGGR